MRSEKDVLLLSGNLIFIHSLQMKHLFTTTAVCVDIGLSSIDYRWQTSTKNKFNLQFFPNIWTFPPRQEQLQRHRKVQRPFLIFWNYFWIS